MTTTTEPRFKPWIGDHYESSKPKILILGESHYGSGSESETFTQQVINDWAIATKGKRAFFTKLAQATSGNFKELTSEEKHTFWHGVAFYNYIQDIVGPKSRISPGKHHWSNAKDPFSNVMQTIKPDVVIVLGVKLKFTVKQIEDSYQEAKFVYWYHPAGSKFKKAEANKALIEVS